MWLSNISILSELDEGYSRKASYALNLIFTFLLHFGQRDCNENDTVLSWRNGYLQRSRRQTFYNASVNILILICHCSILCFLVYIYLLLSWWCNISVSLVPLNNPLNYNFVCISCCLFYWNIIFIAWSLHCSLLYTFSCLG